MYKNRYLIVDNSSLPILYFQARGLPYDQAVKACREDYDGRIVTLDDPALVDRISAVVPTDYSHYYRVGLKKDANEDEFRWEDGRIFQGGILPTPDVVESSSCSAMSIYKEEGSAPSLRPVECGRALAYICQSVPSVNQDSRQEGLRLPLIAAIAAAAIIGAFLLTVVAAFLIHKKRSRSQGGARKDCETEKMKETSLVSVEGEVKRQNKSDETSCVAESTYEDAGYATIERTVDETCKPTSWAPETAVYSMAGESPDMSAVYSVVNKKRRDPDPASVETVKS